MAYANLYDVSSRMTRPLKDSEQGLCTTLLDDAAVLIDMTETTASDTIKKIVSCRMVIRAFSDGEGIPIGASQASMSGLGYSQSWTMGTNGSVGELYLAKSERKMLGLGNSIGSHSPVEDMS